MIARFLPPTCALVVAFSLLATGAQASPFTPELEGDLAFAAAWWGRAPTGCSSTATEVVTRESLTIDGEEAIARATMPRPGEVVPCVMRVAEPEPGALPCFNREVVMHEYGHWLGEGHSADPASIMYPSPPGVLCREEFAATYSAEVWVQLRATQRRCRDKTAPKQRRWCRWQIGQWRKLLADPPG